MPQFCCILCADSSSVEQLNRPSLRDILMEIGTSGVRDYEIMKRWEDIGIQLEIADEQLASIRRRHTTSIMDGSRHDSGQAFRDMIRFWIKQVNPLPTWSKFVEALERLNIAHELTDQLRSKYGTWQSYYCMVGNLLLLLLLSWLIGNHEISIHVNEYLAAYIIISRPPFIDDQYLLYGGLGCGLHLQCD